jgi:hypothetical protein
LGKWTVMTAEDIASLDPPDQARWPRCSHGGRRSYVDGPQT